MCWVGKGVENRRLDRPKHDGDLWGREDCGGGRPKGMDWDMAGNWGGGEIRGSKAIGSTQSQEKELVTDMGMASLGLCSEHLFI